MEAKIVALTSESESHQKAVEDAENRLNEIQQSYEQRSSLEQAARGAEISKLRLDGVIESSRLGLNKISEELRLISQGQPCPTCGTTLDTSHPHVQNQLSVLRTREEEAKQQLRSHEEQLPTLAERASGYQKLVGKADEEIKRQYKSTSATKDFASGELSRTKVSLSAQQREYDQTSGRIAILERDLAKLPDFEASHDEQTKRVKAYSLIGEAFSKRGIPRELKRGFVAEVERHANTIIRSLGDFTIRLSLEKEGKERHGVTEGTLDVWVQDIAGERKLEMFSGGEKQRLSVALRLALATAMAKRTDRSLKTLVIDEALDFLDQSGKDAVLTMIGALSGFERCVFITHDPAIAGMFPDRIEFAKSGDGSSVIL